MADLCTARFVSGEMMASDHDGSRGRLLQIDAIDAEYVEVTSIPHRSPRTLESMAAPVAATPIGMAILQRGANRIRPIPTRGSPLFWLVGGVAVLAAFWVAGGHATIGPGLIAAMTVNEPDLLIANVRSHSEMIEGEAALLVKGDIRNAGKMSGRLPALAVTILTQQGETAAYRLATLRTPLAPGAKYSFSARLDMPKDGVKTVSVAFDH